MNTDPAIGDSVRWLPQPVATCVSLLVGMFQLTAELSEAVWHDDARPWLARVLTAWGNRLA